jgi:hypothetical protein
MDTKAQRHRRVIYLDPDVTDQLENERFQRNALGMPRRDGTYSAIVNEALRWFMFNPSARKRRKR